MKKLFSIAAIALGAALAFPSYADSSCDQFVPFGYPTVQTKHKTQPLCRIAYFTLHDNERKVPLYSAEFLLKENVTGKTPRGNDFRADPNLAVGERSELNDYKSGGYDRGHMAPAEDFRKNTSLMSQSFYLSNMVPQAPTLNRGTWRMLEMYVMQRVQRGENLYVITGPLYENDKTLVSTDHPDGTLGSNHVAIPTHTWKVIVNKDSMKAEAYLMPNDDTATAKFTTYRVPLNVIEQEAHIVLFPALEAAQRNALRAQ